LIDSFDFSKFSRGTPKFDPDELIRLNSKILHETSFNAIRLKLVQMGLENLDEDFWLAVRPNLEKLADIESWWHVANGPVQPVIEDAEFITAAAALLPPAPWDENTWGVWTKAVKEATGRKGRQLFMPLRQAITGMDHGPELNNLLILIGPEKVKERLGTKKAA
jgi:glutamyl-tRNA synthetase